MFGMCDAGFWSFNFFVSHIFPQLNVKEGAGGYTWICSSAGAGFCPPTACRVTDFRALDKWSKWLLRLQLRCKFVHAAWGHTFVTDASA